MINANGFNLMETVNGGNTWGDFTPYCDFDGCFLEDVCFVDSVHGWYTVIEVLGCRDVTSLYYTENKGYTWEWQMSCLGELSVDFINTQVGWAINDGALWFTWNGGEYWDSTYAYLDKSVVAAYFIDLLAGWAIGVDSSIVHTFDGGLTWEAQFIATENLYDIHFVDHKSGWVVGDNGLILHTKNAGENWVTQNSGTTEELYDVCFVDIHNGWIAGDDGTILHTENGGTVSTGELKRKNNEIVIYPNPCSDAMHLRYLIHDSGHLISDLYSIDGRKIRELINEVQMPGEHEMKLDVTDLTPGVYLIRLQIGNETTVRKLVVSD
jgi:photosystem II stability/assembly factor-like uncharacterized protein